MQNQKSALGLDGNVTALIGYLIGIVALVLIFIEKDNKFVRFHALQSFLWSVICVVGIFAVAIIGTILALVLGQVASGLGAIVGILAMLLYLGIILGMLGGLIFAAIKAYGGAEFKLPIAGNLAQKWV
jgi:uncharacterized membrane protein